MIKSYAGKIAFIDLSKGEISVEKTDESIAREFIGGYGYAVRVMFERQRPRVNPLGDENTLGFMTGPLTGTKAPTGSRYTAVCKSPLTGGWGDANSGGFFGSELKAAGWDGIFINGIAPKPKYILVRDGKIEIKDASELWGKDTITTDDILRNELENPKIKIACIGPASEKLSLISGIVNERGRIAARSGVGAVMGAKLLKAIAVKGRGKIAVADEKELNRLRKDFLKELKASEGFPKELMKYGTCAFTGGFIAGGAAPVKNWRLAGESAFPNYEDIANAEKMIEYQTKKYACANCPIGCGGVIKVSEGPYAISELHKPEYETIAAFGPLCMNTDLLSIIKLNDMCNRSGLDTMSAGSVIAFAMECYENGIITQEDTDGIDLTWGDPAAMIAILQKIIDREGLGDVLADGVKVAAEKIGGGSEKYAMHVGGQEAGLQSPLFLPGRGAGFVCDPTPGRHTTTGPLGRVDASITLAPYPELEFKDFERYDYKHKGKAYARASCYWQIGTCSGVCLFPVVYFGNYRLLEFLNSATGWEMDMEQALLTGARIQSLRQLFNVREGINPKKIGLPPRLAGLPPMQKGPVKGITIDIDSLRYQFYKGLGWDPETGVATQSTVKDLGLTKLIGKYGQDS
jgi:aldehyde:ferredoxin oxidoreductase